MEGIIDSGAAGPVAPLNITRDKPDVDPATSKNCYITADGTPLKNQCVKTVVGTTREGHRLEMRFQMADVAKPLMSVSKICDRGNTVVFEKTGGYIVGPTGSRRIPFQRKGGVYVLPTKVEQAEPVFVRPGSNP